MYSEQLDRARTQIYAQKSFHLADGEEYRQIAVVPMTVAEWISVPDNPIQRNTAARAARADHLKIFEPLHAEVSMAVLPDGSRFKLDGHTRAHKWASGEVRNLPHIVEVKVYACRSLNAVMRLYGRYDSKLAVDTVTDQVFGAVRRAEITFRSPMMRAGKFSNAVKQLYGEIFSHDSSIWAEPSAMAEAISLFRDELVLLDSVDPGPKRLTAGLVQAALATFMHDGENALPFWRAVALDQGQKGTERMDAVYALSAAVASEQAKRSRDAHTNLFRKAIAAYLTWRAGKFYAAGPRWGMKGISADSARDYCRMAYERRQARAKA